MSNETKSVAEKTNALAGEPPPLSMLVNVPRLVTAYYAEQPDPSIAAQRVAFGTSGHRGSAFKITFNEWHVLAISQGICDHRKRQGISGPLYLGIDAHALSVSAYASALEVLAANGVEVMLEAPANHRVVHGGPSGAHRKNGCGVCWAASAKTLLWFAPGFATGSDSSELNSKRSKTQRMKA
jgi:hypothetical protein